MTTNDIDTALLDAVFAHDTTGVERCLQQGANPDFRAEADPDLDRSVLQPDTPLKAVMFCISDALLEEQGLRDFKDIAQLLLAHGADPRPALELAEQRYGEYDPGAAGGTFMEVWRVVKEAAP